MVASESVRDAAARAAAPAATEFVCCRRRDPPAPKTDCESARGESSGNAVAGCYYCCYYRSLAECLLGCDARLWRCWQPGENTWHNVALADVVGHHTVRNESLREFVKHRTSSAQNACPKRGQLVASNISRWCAFMCSLEMYFWAYCKVVSTVDMI